MTGNNGSSTSAGTPRRDASRRDAMRCAGHDEKDVLRGLTYVDDTPRGEKRPRLRNANHLVSGETNAKVEILYRSSRFPFYECAVKTFLIRLFITALFYNKQYCKLHSRARERGDRNRLFFSITTSDQEKKNTGVEYIAIKTAHKCIRDYVSFSRVILCSATTRS